jgi:hypothetical protein
MNLHFHCVMCVPSDEQHAKIHTARSKDRMEESIAIWYVFFRYYYHYYVPELQCLKNSLSVIT